MAGSIYSTRIGACYTGCGKPEAKTCPHRRNGHTRWGFHMRYRKIGPGKWEERRRQGFPTRAAAQDALTDLAGDVRRGTALSNAQLRITVGEYVDSWLAGRVKIRPATRRSYSLVIRDYIKPGLGRIPLAELNTPTVRSWLDRIRTGRLGPGPSHRGPDGLLSASTVNLIYAILRAALTAAVTEQMLTRNPCTGVELEDAETAEGKVWSPTQVSAFLAYVEDADPPWAAIAYRLALRFGLRRGEIAALRWQDVTAEAITVRQNAVAVGAEVVIGPLKARKKGKDSSRTLPLALDPDMAAVLKSARKRQLRTQGGSLVITDERGDAVPPWRLTDTFRRLAEEAGLPVIRLHDARHTCGSLLYEATLDLKKVQKWLGHHTASITADLYVHDRPETDSAAADQVARYLAQ
jgi:integrase